MTDDYYESEHARLSEIEATKAEQDRRALAGEARCPTTCDHGSQCLLRIGHFPTDRHETEHGCICYDPRAKAATDFLDHSIPGDAAGRRGGAGVRCEVQELRVLARGLHAHSSGRQVRREGRGEVIFSVCPLCKRPPVDDEPSYCSHAAHAQDSVEQFLRARLVEAEAARDHYIKHADEGWALANRRTVQWKQAERERDEARAEVEKAHESVDGLSKVPRGRPLWTRVETALLDVGDDAANYSRQAAKARLSARAWKALASVYRASMSLCSGPCHLFVRERRPARRTHGR